MYFKLAVGQIGSNCIRMLCMACGENSKGLALWRCGWGYCHHSWGLFPNRLWDRIPPLYPRFHHPCMNDKKDDGTTTKIL